MRALAILAGALTVLAVWAQVAHACSCVPQNPAKLLADADAALVGEVEGRTADPAGGKTYTIRVERALKGPLGARVTLPSPLNSCEVNYDVGQRVAVVLSGTPETWTVGTCNSVDADALLAAAELPEPSGSARFVAAVDGETVDTVALGSSGKPAGYGWREGKPLALASCGATGSAMAFRGRGGKVFVGIRLLPDMIGTGSPSTLKLSNVTALRCSGDARTFWAAGEQGDRTVVVEVRRRQGSDLLFSAPANAAVAFSGPRAYVASQGRVDVVTLAGGRVRTIRNARVAFAQIAVNGNRAAGRRMGGGSAVLDLRSGRLQTRRDAGSLAWLDAKRLLDTSRGLVLDARLRMVRRVSDVGGTVVAVSGGAAYIADGDRLRRLARGARRATEFARLPGKVVALTPARVSATAAWHSCKKSAKLTLTT